MAASCLPSAVVWMSEAARPQYSYEVLEKKILGTTFSAARAIEQAALLVSERINFGLVGERKDVGGKEYGRGRLRIARGLGEAVVEAAAACTGDVREHAIESDAAIFIGIESLIEKIAQEAAILRDAFAEHTRRRRDGVRRVLCIRGEVAYGGEAESGNDRIGDHVDIFVNAAGLEAAVEMDGPVARRELAIDRRGKLPLRSAGCVVRLPSRESRTVSVLRGSSGCATGYSEPPMCRPSDGRAEFRRPWRGA